MILADEGGAYEVSYMMGRVVGFIIILIVALLVIKVIKNTFSRK